jgi:hypothetical protein
MRGAIKIIPPHESLESCVDRGVLEHQDHPILDPLKMVNLILSIVEARMGCQLGNGLVGRTN